jgi:uncharacterized protein (TIRG00374 family)
MKGRIISITAALVLLAGLIYFSGPDKIVGTLLRTNLFIAAAGFGVMVVGAVLRTERWRYLLRRAGISVPFGAAMKVYVAGLFLSNVTPGKSGDPIRSVLLKKVCGYKVSSSLPSVIAERALDVGSMVLLGVVGLVMVAASAASAVMPFFMAAIAVYASIFLVAMFALSSESRARWTASKLNKIASRIPKIKNYSGRAEEFMINMQKSLMLYWHKKTLITGMLYSITIWALESVILYVAFLSLGFNITYAAAMAAICVSTLIAVLTFLPGGIGSSEVIAVAFLTSLFPLSAADVTAAALLNRFIGFWVYTVVGAGLLATMRYRYSI